MTSNRRTSDTDNFNKLLQGTSNRLRGRSVPPPNSEPIIPNAQAINQRVTLMVPGTNAAQPVLPAGNRLNNSSENSLNVPSTPATSVIHLSGLLSKDNINDLPNSQSPMCRDTIKLAGGSPPQGFHLWLVANGLTVINNTALLLLSTQGVSPTTAKQMALSVANVSLVKPGIQLPNGTRVVTKIVDQYVATGPNEFVQIDLNVVKNKVILPLIADDEVD
ncbi:hypothetical protein DFH28DRAFT_929352 [Melampsora americana]|nr:hypothetical protein DFH28DRAFT_929352 [Melampsora americana]